jgi:hypothetical protein
MSDVFDGCLREITALVGPACGAAWQEAPIGTSARMNLGDFGPRGIDRIVARMECAVIYRFGFRLSCGADGYCTGFDAETASARRGSNSTAPEDPPPAVRTYHPVQITLKTRPDQQIQRLRRPRLGTRSCGRYWDRTSDLSGVNGRDGMPLTSDFATDLQSRNADECR